MKCNENMKHGNSLLLFFIIIFSSAKLAYTASLKYTLTQFDTLEGIQNKK